MRIQTKKWNRKLIGQGAEGTVRRISKCRVEKEWKPQAIYYGGSPPLTRWSVIKQI